MSQISLFESSQAPPLHVAELTRRIRERLEGSPDLQNIWVTGEVSNASRPSSGHFYFTLKDAQASLRCVMWKMQVQRLRFLPRDGDMVETFGSISVYDAGGQYQLYAEDIRPVGQGLLYQEFLRLKSMLEAEGLFDPSRKLPLPPWPRRIGVITSPTGAALQDILNTLRRRFPLAEVVLAPTAVQGLDAPPQIIRSLQLLAEVEKPDLILLARGGGSIEDLWAFNDERVVRAVADCPVPVVAGIGHETDFTLSDFAADVRAPTPTAAAEIATPNRADLLLALQETGQRLNRLLDLSLKDRRWELSESQNLLLRRSPEARLRSDRQRLDEWLTRLHRAVEQGGRMRGLRFESARSRLEGANPLAVMQRGFSLVTGPDGRLVRSVAQVKAGDRLDISVLDGSIPVEVLSPEEKKQRHD